MLCDMRSLSQPSSKAWRAVLERRPSRSTVGVSSRRILSFTNVVFIVWCRPLDEKARLTRTLRKSFTFACYSHLIPSFHPVCLAFCGCGLSSPHGLPMNERKKLIQQTELEIWRYVDAPRMLGGEDLSVSDFVKIFQRLVEGMLACYDTAADRVNPSNVDEQGSEDTKPPKS